jgi:hypothetical protein
MEEYYSNNYNPINNNQIINNGANNYVTNNINANNSIIPSNESELNNSLKNFTPPTDNSAYLAKNAVEYFSAYSIMNNMNTTNDLPLVNGIIYNPYAVATDNSFPASAALPSQCESCSAYLNLYTISLHNQWRCLFCSHVNHSIFDIPQTKLLQCVVASTADTTPHRPLYIILIDAHTAPAYLASLQSDLYSLLSNERERGVSGNIVLMSYSNVVNIYQLSLHTLINTLTLPANIVDSSSLNLLPYIGTIGNDLNSLYNSMTAMIEAAEHNSSQAQPTSLYQPRAIGSALQLSLNFLQHFKPFSSGKLLLFTTGPSDFGLDSPSLWANLGTQFAAHHMQLIINCLGGNNFNLSSLRLSAESSGGYIFQYNNYCSNSNLFLDLQKCVSNTLGCEGRVSIIHSASIKFDRIIGHARLRNNHKSQANQIELSSVGCVSSDSHYTLTYSLNDSLTEDYIYFQFISVYNNHHNQTIYRISNRRIRVTGNLNTYLHSLDIHTNLIIYARILALKALQWNEKPEQLSLIQSTIDRYIRDLYKSFALNNELPSALAALPFYLYSLRRGVFGDFIQSNDARLILLYALLHCDYELAKAFIYPATERFKLQPNNDNIDNTQSTPVESTVDELNEYNMLLSDSGSVIYIWSGSCVLSDAYDFYRSIFINRANILNQHRLPTAEISLLNQKNSSSQRWLVARLLPASTASANSSLLPSNELSYQQFINLLNK